MYEQVAKPKENKSQAVSNVVSQKQSAEESTFQFVDNRPEAVAQRKLQAIASNSPQAIQLQAKVHKMAQTQPVQFFKDVVRGPDITPAQIAAADLVTLQAWLARETEKGKEVWDWDDDRHDTIPEIDDKVLINRQIDVLKTASKLADLGVTAPELSLFQTTTTDESVIRNAAAHCRERHWDITNLLTSIAGAGDSARSVAISVLAKKEVTTSASVTYVANNWAVLQTRDNIPVSGLITLINDGAVTTDGGIYNYPKQLRGVNEHYAYTFYINGVQRLRLDPEWHVHVQVDGQKVKPGFKKKAEKYTTGPGTRRDTNRSETVLLLKAVGHA
jgi:hypothetical protein